MVRVDISEFTFGYAFLHEQTLLNSENLRAAPILPSLREEVDEGWDAHLPVVGIDYYYQFKLSDYLSYPNASFIRDGTYTSPYYRIQLYRHNQNRQHQRLKEHTIDHPDTYYVAPEFFNKTQFDSAFLSQQVTAHSRLIPLNECDNITDNEQHYITYQPDNPDWILHSEKKINKNSFFGKNIFEIYEKSKSNWKTIDKQFSTDLFFSTTNEIQIIMDKEGWQIDEKKFELLNYDPERGSRIETLTRTSRILSIFYGVVLVIIGV